eukprot:TRINITY_DN512_c1_g1_i1.p1 TRINITY_DN512_c1_g1~~TRINITY_DN512_c1_g1_i1.p1  ORF type:complete len:356 (-),score=62.03 TRINITY_DN512_c1_g1_i1:360-1427(-)
MDSRPTHGKKGKGKRKRKSGGASNSPTTANHKGSGHMRHDTDRKKKKRKRKIGELQGLVVNGGTLVLHDVNTGVVYSSERDDRGRLVRIGTKQGDDNVKYDPLSAEDGSLEKKRKKEKAQQQQQQQVEQNGKRKAKPFGKYFPNAVRIPGSTLPAGIKECTILLFYQYADPLWTENEKAEAMSKMQTVGIDLGLGGRIRISREGFNSTLSGARSNVEKFCRVLRDWRPANFTDTDFKLLHGLPVRQVRHVTSARRITPCHALRHITSRLSHDSPTSSWPSLPDHDSAYNDDDQLTHSTSLARSQIRCSTISTSSRSKRLFTTGCLLMWHSESHRSVASICRRRSFTKSWRSPPVW